MSINGGGHWFGVRCVFQWADGPSFEERITLWQASDFDAAVVLAEEDSEAYAEATGAVFLGFAQAYALPDPPGQGAEVFSLFRDSDLDSDEYLDRFFDTGDEQEASLDED